MDKLAPLDTLVIRQKKEMAEILTGFETKNKYQIMTSSGAELFFAAETGGNVLARIFLKALRPFTITVLKPDNQVLITVNRPFRFYFHEAEILDANGARLGSLKKEFSLIRRIYKVYGPTGAEIYELFGPLLHPWTFQIKKGGIEEGKITKKWSGLLKEGFTDADNFGITFPQHWDVNLKALFLGVVFLIDFAHFENKGN